MMRRAELTLNKVKESEKAIPVHVSRLSDFVSSEETEELRAKNAQGSKRKKKFNAVDSYVAEIIARFGYEAYKDWNMGIIPNDKMERLIWAERGRERALLNNLEAIITLNGMAGATSKKSKQPIDKAIQQIKENEKIVKGEA